MGAGVDSGAARLGRSGDVASSRTVVLDWHLEIFGYRPMPAHIEARPRSRVRRALTAAAALTSGCTIAPVMIVMPPHFDPAVITVLMGVYLARACWQGRYTNRAFAGACPRCQHPLRVRCGALLRVPHAVHCPRCRDTARLLPGPADDAASGHITPGGHELSPGEARAADLAWRRRRSKLSPSSWSPASGDWAPGQRTEPEAKP